MGEPADGSANLRLVVGCLVELQRLEHEGRDDSLAGDVTRDSMDAPVAALSDVERQWVQWLSEALYSLNRDEGLRHDEMPSREKLRARMRRCRPPQEWYDAEMECPFGEGDSDAARESD